jgi:hypothetical protein
MRVIFEPMKLVESVRQKDVRNQQIAEQGESFLRYGGLSPVGVDFGGLRLFVDSGNGKPGSLGGTSVYDASE